MDNDMMQDNYAVVVENKESRCNCAIGELFSDFKFALEIAENMAKGHEGKNVFVLRVSPVISMNKPKSRIETKCESQLTSRETQEVDKFFKNRE